MQTSSPVLLMLLLLVSLAVASVNAEAPTGTVKEAIEHLQRTLPDLDISSESKWKLRIFQAITELKAHPKFSKIVKADDAAAAAAADSRTNYNFPTFNCRLDKSPSVPTSVHKLRPGDVKVIAAMGDSLTAANGARASNILGVLSEHRGYAWSIGGEVTLDQHVTLANVLRKGNSGLYGFSTGTGSSTSRVAKLNVAVPGNEANHMLGQAKELVNRLNSDKEVDSNNDWKVITLFVGGNDLCRFCNDVSKYSAANYIKHIKAALDYLHQNVRRAFVNVAEVLDVSVAKKLKDGSLTCRVLHGSLLCSCGAYPKDEAQERQLEQLKRDYQSLLRNLVSSGRYDTREDFTVVNQPFYRDTNPPKTSSGDYDLSYFAPDCFHFSQKGHAAAGKALWNNMLQPVGRKSTTWELSSGFRCPSSSRPYFMTSKNS